MKVKELLQTVNNLGAKAIPVIGPFLAEAVRLNLAAGSDAEIQRQLQIVAKRTKGQQRTLDYLIAALTQEGAIAVEFIESLADLQHALENPDDPPLRVRAALDQLAARFGEVETLRTWAEVEFKNLASRVEHVELRIAELEERNQGRQLDESLIGELELLCPLGCGTVIVWAEGEPESQQFASQIRDHLLSRGHQVEPLRVGTSIPPVIGLAFVKNREGSHIRVGHRPLPGSRAL